MYERVSDIQNNGTDWSVGNQSDVSTLQHLSRKTLHQFDVITYNTIGLMEKPFIHYTSTIESVRRNFLIISYEEVEKVT